MSEHDDGKYVMVPSSDTVKIELRKCDYRCPEPLKFSTGCHAGYY
jgi:hypothetical protein